MGIIDELSLKHKDLVKGGILTFEDGEKVNVAAQNPKIVEKLKIMLERIKNQNDH